MLDQDLGDLASQEVLRKAVEAFNKLKENEQDRILERTGVVPEKEVKEIAQKFKIQEEIAKAIFVLEFEFDIPKELSANYYKYEINRLKEAKYELPDIYSFLIRFSMEEGFWIKYATGDFSKKLLKRVTKLITLDRSLFGDLAGEKEDAALYIIERSYITSEVIKPLLYSWLQDHKRANFYDATLSIICFMQQKAREKGEVIASELCNRIEANLDSIGSILTELESKSWAKKAVQEYKDVQKNLQLFKKDKTQISWRLASELILENKLLMEYNALDLKTNITFPAKSTSGEKNARNPSKIAEKEGIIDDKITRTIVTVERLSLEKVQASIEELVRENFEVATKTHKQKPSYFAKEFLERILNEFGITQMNVAKLMKKFDVQLMYRLSPMGAKEYPGMSVDEKVQRLLEETILNIYTTREDLRKEIGKLVETNQTSNTSARTTITKTADEEKATTEIRMGEKLKASSEKELWILVRDEYLKELFNEPEELIAGAKLLKKLSLELGLLLTESESTTIITSELEKMGLKAVDENKEDLDKNICKIIYARVKDQRIFS